MDLKSYLNPSFIQELQDLADTPDIKAEIAKFDKLGGLDPACFLELCCKYLKEFRIITAPCYISKRFINDLKNLCDDIACQSEDVMYDIDVMFERDFATDADFMRKYMDWEERSHLSVAYEQAILEYKKDHPDAYFSGQNGELQFVTCDLYEICVRILMEKFAKAS